MPSGPRMWIRMAPPGRTSSSQTVLVKYLGPHHFIICSWSIHALNTTSRGASKTRVISTLYLFGGSSGVIVSLPWLLSVRSILLLLLLELGGCSAEQMFYYGDASIRYYLVT